MAERILVALDGTTTAEQTLAYAALLAAFRNADLLLARAVAPPPSWVVWGGREHVAALSDAEASLAMQRERLAKQGILAESAIVTGGPAGVLLQLARDRSATLIVMAARGRTTMPSRAAGTVTEHVLAQAPCPVLLLTPRALEAGGAERLLQRALVTVDDEGLAGPAGIAIARLAVCSSGPVTLVHAAAPLPGTDTDLRPCFPRVRATDRCDLYHEAVAAALRSLRPLADEWRWHGFDAEVVVEVGHAAEVIVRVATKRHAGLIAMSRCGRGRRDRVALGSTVSAVLRQTTLPVLVDAEPSAIPAEASGSAGAAGRASGRRRVS